MKTLFSKGFYQGIVIGFLFLVLAVAFSRYLEIPYRSFNLYYWIIIIMFLIIFFLCYYLIKKYFTPAFMIFLIGFILFLFLKMFLKFDVFPAFLFSSLFILGEGSLGGIIKAIVSKKYLIGLLAFIIINILLFNFLIGTEEAAIITPNQEGISYLYYGSGVDKRDVYHNPDIMTKTIDGSKYLQLSGLQKKYRESSWGFGMDNLPLNAKVYFPQQKAHLIIIVHGNHFGDMSEEGYDYLAKTLVSKGYIFVSIDENFLNSNPFLGSLSGEEELRARIILEHLKLWLEWNEDSHNQFYNKVDLNDITLIGHSKGGEAAALAVKINEEEKLGFKINNLIQIAPSVDEPIELNINYLLILGGYDGDRYTLEGKKQYDKITGLKSLICILYANHVKFNSVWGETDMPIPKGWLLNQKPILSSGEQQDLTKEYISDFLEKGFVSSNLEVINPQLMKFDFLEKNYFTEENYLVENVWKEKNILTK